MCKDLRSCHAGMRAVGLLGLRVALGIIFIAEGVGKLGPGREMALKLFASGGLPEWLVPLVGVLELTGGLMVLLGIYAPYAATWLALIPLGAMLTVHRGGPAFGYFLPLAVLGGCLALMGVGAGRYRLVKTECRCGKCKTSHGAPGGGAGSCSGDDSRCDCAGNCSAACRGDSAGPTEMNKTCACQGCCSGQCGCGAKGGGCGCGTK
ncbi:MAG: DoxX family protein [Candidatus Magasanikbacteria bacterium]|nr:DoxX family protein [Candidatus Magasanikbacteria bacterium]